MIDHHSFRPVYWCALNEVDGDSLRGQFVSVKSQLTRLVAVITLLCLRLLPGDASKIEEVLYCIHLQIITTKDKNELIRISI